MNDDDFAELIRDARNWLEDAFPDYVDHIKTLWPSQVRRAVQRHYEGGWDAFLSDCGVPVRGAL